MWQDYIFMLGGFFIAASHLPSIFSENKPHRASCVSMGIILAIFSATYFTLGLYFATFSMSLISLAWWILFFQKRPKKNRLTKFTHMHETHIDEIANSSSKKLEVPLRGSYEYSEPPKRRAKPPIPPI